MLTTELAEELNEEDLQLKSDLEMMVERLTVGVARTDSRPGVSPNLSCIIY